MFRGDAKRLYRELEKKTIKIQKPPDIGEVKKFWQNILGHHEDVQWMKDQQEELKDINQMEWKDFTVEELGVNITRAANWKSPGPDKLPNFWIKQFTSLHTPMAKAYSQIVQDPLLTPEWLVLPKKEATWIPKNYRPIACLPTILKIQTSVITDRLYSHLEKESIMTPEQRGGKKDFYGCKDQLMINNVILENCKKKKKNLSTAWIDYKKAFDSVHHSWILACLKMYKINPVLTTFIEASMRQWKTNLVLVHESRVLEKGPISNKKGIFQGNSLSPLLFTMSLNPLCQELQKTGYGYQLDKQTKISHLFYVDDLKLYGTSDSQLNGLISTVKKVSDDIQMEFGLDKCAKATFKRGKKVSAEDILLNDHQLIQDLDQAETYKYLGMEEGEGVPTPPDEGQDQEGIQVADQTGSQL